MNVPQIEIRNIKDGLPTEPYDFFIDRRSPVGNPFPLKKESRRQSVCEAYEEYFSLKIRYDSTEFIGYLECILKALQLYGKVRLFCWCSPKQCHGETIKGWLINCYETNLSE